MKINRLTVALDDFKLSTVPFAKRRAKLGTVLLAYSSGFLSIESGDIKVVMNAVGEWHGRASFSPEILRALSTIPPTTDPLVFEYENGYIKICATKISCEWEAEITNLKEYGEEFSLLDLLALEKTMPRVKIRSSEIGLEITKAKNFANKKIQNAARELEKLEISEDDIRYVLESKIYRKINHI